MKPIYKILLTCGFGVMLWVSTATVHNDHKPKSIKSTISSQRKIKTNPNYVDYKDGNKPSRSKNSSNNTLFTKAFHIDNMGKITCRLLDKQGNLWVGTDKSWVWEWPKDNPTKTPIKCKFVDITNNPPTPINYHEEKINAILQGKSGNIFVGVGLVSGSDYLGNQGLWEFDAKDNYFIHCTFKDHNDFNLNYEAAIETMIIDENNQIWIGTANYGLLNAKIPASGPWKFHTDSYLCHYFQVNAIFEDREKNLWVGAFSSPGGSPELDGTWMKKSSSSKFVQVQEGKITEASAFCEDLSGNFFIGTENGVWWRQAKQTEFKFLIGGGSIDFIYTDQFNIIWIAIYAHGLTELEIANGHVVPRNVDELGGSITYGMYRDNDFNLWVASDQGLFCLHTSTNKFVKITLPGSTATEAQSIFINKNHSLLVETADYNIYKKLTSGVSIKFGVNTASYVNSSDFDLITTKSFKINLDKNIVDYISINNGSKLTGSSYNIPNSKYKAGMNQTVLININYKNGLPSETRRYLIKATYLDNGQLGKSNLLAALSTNNSILPEAHTVVFQQTKTRYQFIFVQGKVNAPPNLTITHNELNFLTELNNSSLGTIKFSKGKMTIVSPKFIQTYKPTTIINGSNVNNANLHELNLVDHLGNNQTYILQVGGDQINSNFKIVLPNETSQHSNTWKYLLSFFVILISACSIMFLFWLRLNRKSIGLALISQQKGTHLPLKYQRMIALAKSKKTVVKKSRKKHHRQTPKRLFFK